MCLQKNFIIEKLKNGLQTQADIRLHPFKTILIGKIERKKNQIAGNIYGSTILGIDVTSQTTLLSVDTIRIVQ